MRLYGLAALAALRETPKGTAMDRARFFDAIRPLHGGSLSQAVVSGYTLILDEFVRRMWKDDRHLAYILATTYHETARTMQPVRETLADSDEKAIAILEKAWAGGKLPWVKRAYWRKDSVTGVSYLGRGYVQLTHKDGYARAGAKLGVELVYHPDLAMDPKVALPILFDGMGEGWFVPHHNLTRYFREGVDDPVGARRIINGTDKAAAIAALHDRYLNAIKGAA